MKMKTTLIFAVLLFSKSSYANDFNHTLGTNWGVYTNHKLDVDNETYDSIELGLSADIYYRYKPVKYFGVEVGYMFGGDGPLGEWANKHEIIQDLDYDAGRVAIYGTLPISSWINVYGKIGYAHIFLDYKVDGVEKSSESSGFYRAVGFESLWGSGFGVNIDYQLTSGDNIEIDTFNIGLSYHF